VCQGSTGVECGDVGKQDAGEDEGSGCQSKMRDAVWRQNGAHEPLRKRTLSPRSKSYARFIPVGEDFSRMSSMSICELFCSDFCIHSGFSFISNSFFRLIRKETTVVSNAASRKRFEAGSGGPQDNATSGRPLLFVS
jgi:hypothetical protein